METQHTRGPWEYADGHIQTSDNVQYVPIAEVCNTDNKDANARLIAAAAAAVNAAAHASYAAAAVNAAAHASYASAAAHAAYAAARNKMRLKIIKHGIKFIK